jgi:hypothetical protein
MAKPRDAVKERYWRNLIRRYRASGLGARQFCERVGIPPHRLHWWRRTLRDRDRFDEDGDTNEAAGEHAVDASNAEYDGSPFVPIHLPFSLGNVIEVVHPRGYIVRVPAGFDATMLQRILDALEPPAGP